MKTLIIGLMLCSFALAQVARPPLDGATILIDGSAERYRLSAIVEAPTTAPASERTFAMSAGRNSVFVHAIDLPFDPMTTRYTWDFNDPTGRRSTLPGFVAGHVYDQPGKYTITLTVKPVTGDPVRYQRSIEIAPDQRRAVYVSASGIDTNDGSRASPVRTLQRAGAIAASDVSILLERGQVFDAPATVLRPQKNVSLGAYGDDKLPNPVIRYTGQTPGEPIVRCSAQTSDLTIERITFDSIAGNKPDAKEIPDALAAAGERIVVRDCVFLNINYAINGNGQPQGVIVQKCDAPNVDGVRGYLAWVEGADWVLTDNRFANSTRQHAIRAWGWSRMLIAFSELSNLDRTRTDPVDIAKNTLNLQSGEYAYVHGNTLRGPSSIGPLGKSDGMKYSQQRSRYYVVEANRFEKSPLGVQHGLSDVSIRENWFAIDGLRCIEVDGFDATYQRGIANLVITNNGAENRSSSGGFLYVGGRVEGITLLGNRYNAPLLEPGANHCATVYVNDRDLGSFRAIRNNIWPAGQPKPFAEGGTMFVGQNPSDAKGYLDHREWLSQPGVSGDRFVD